MSAITIIIWTVIIALFCLGWRTVISEGQLLHFLREPFEYSEGSKMINFLKRIVQKAALRGETNLIQKKKYYEKLSNRITWFLKPFLLCVICFASAWGVTLFITFNGLAYWREMIVACVSAAFLIKVLNDKIDW